MGTHREMMLVRGTFAHELCRLAVASLLISKALSLRPCSLMAMPQSMPLGCNLAPSRVLRVGRKLPGPSQLSTSPEMPACLFGLGVVRSPLPEGSPKLSHVSLLHVRSGQERRENTYRLEVACLGVREQGAEAHHQGVPRAPEITFSFRSDPTFHMS